MVEIPVDGQDDALLERGLGVPAQIVLDLGGVDAVAAVVAQTVGNVLDQILADAVVLQAVVQLRDDGLDDEDVGALVVAAHIVDLADLAAVADHIDGLAVILNVQPVTDLHTVTVDRQLLVVLDVVDHQGDQLLRELIGTVVVGAAGNVDGHTVGIVECHNEHISAGLGGGIGAVGAQRGGLHEVALGTQSAVDLIGGDLQILLAFLPGLGISIVPGFLGTLQQVHGAHDVALDKDLGVLDGTVHMALSGKVDDIIEIVLCKQAFHQLLVADVALHEHMAGVALHVLQVLQIAGIGQLIQVDQADILVFFQHIVDKVGANKTGTAGNKISFHLFTIPIIEKVLNCIFPVAHVIADTAPQVAVIRVGAATETEMKESKLRLEDALAATKAAVEEGIIFGGGSAYIHASKKAAEKVADLEGDEKTGANIILKALEAPLFQIAVNAGLEGAVIVNKVKEAEIGKGFDALHGEYVDMVEAGIIDPAKVTRSALQNATSVASTLLTTESVVANIKEDAPAMPAGAPAGMGMM